MIIPSISNLTLLNTINLVQSSVKKMSHSFSKHLGNITNSAKEIDSNRVGVSRSVFYIDIKDPNKPPSAAVVVEKRQAETKAQLRMNTPVELNKFSNDYKEITKNYSDAALQNRNFSENYSPLRNRLNEDIKVSFQDLKDSYKDIQAWSKKFNSLCVLDRVTNTKSRGPAELLNQELEIFKENIVDFNLNKNDFDQKLRQFTAVVKQSGITSSLQTHGRFASDASEDSLYEDTSLSDHSGVIYSDIIYSDTSDSDSPYDDTSLSDHTDNEPIYSVISHRNHIYIDIDTFTGESKC